MPKINTVVSLDQTETRDAIIEAAKRLFGDRLPPGTVSSVEWGSADDGAIVTAKVLFNGNVNRT